MLWNRPLVFTCYVILAHKICPSKAKVEEKKLDEDNEEKNLGLDKLMKAMIK